VQGDSVNAANVATHVGTPGETVTITPQYYASSYSTTSGETFMSYCTCWAIPTAA
jgi:hypothetical protein